MKSSNLAYAAFAAIASITAASSISGCATSDDVYFKSTAQKEVAACTVAAGDDICARVWPADDTPTPAVIGVVEAVAAVKTITQIELQRLFDMCEVTLDSLAMPHPTMDPTLDITLKDRTRKMCDAATLALNPRLASNSMFSLTEAKSVCTPTVAPTCATLAPSERKTCVPPSVSIAFKDGAGSTDHIFGQVALHNAPIVLQIDSEIEEAYALLEAITKLSSTIGAGAVTSPSPCTTAWAPTIEEAVGEMETITNLTFDFAQTFGTPD